MPRKRKQPRPPGQGFVLDCSIVFAWYFTDESDAYADEVATTLAVAKPMVPTHFPLEVANTLVVGERRGRSTAAQAAAFVGFLEALPIDVDVATHRDAWSTTMDIARRCDLSAYDAAYLELALRRASPLATLDANLRNAAQSLGVAAYAP